MKNKELYASSVGVLATNCYLLVNTDSRRAVLVDPGAEIDKLTAMIKEAHADPEAILLTHGHSDHTGAIPDLLALYPSLRIYAGAGEERMLTYPSINDALGPIDFTVRADVFLREGDTVNEAGMSFKVLETPGHSAGSVCYYLEDEKILFSGDTLFKGSYGRTDLPTGSGEAILRSLRKLAERLPDDVRVFPGHGGMTTIGREKRINPGL